MNKQIKASMRESADLKTWYLGVKLTTATSQMWERFTQLWAILLICVFSYLVTCKMSKTNQKLCVWHF